jgi:hypothetical protein
VSLQLFAGLAAASPGKREADGAAFRLTSENVRKTTEVIRIINGKIKANPSLAKRLRAPASAREDGVDNGDEFSIDQVAQQIEGEPVMRQALTAAGISSRDFELTQFSIFTASMTVMARKMGDKSRIEGVAAANVTWLENHPAEVQRFGEQMKENQRLLDPGTERRSRSEEEPGGAEQGGEKGDN